MCAKQKNTLAEIGDLLETMEAYSAGLALTTRIWGLLERGEFTAQEIKDAFAESGISKADAAAAGLSDAIVAALFGQ